MKLSDILFRLYSIQIIMKYILLVMFTVCMFHVGLAHADALTDLRTTLQSLNANTQITGTLDVQSTKVTQKVDKGKSREVEQRPPAELNFDINTGDGLGIHLSQALLQQVNAEQQAHADDPEKPTPITDLLRDADPMQVEHIVSAAPMLLHELDGAKSPTVTSAQLDGSPVQVLTVTVPLKVSKKDSSNVKDYQGVMTIWINAQGMPLAYQQTFHAKFCKFLFCVTVDEVRNGKLQAYDGRLVAMSYTDEHKQSGMGQDMDTKTTYTLSMNDASGNKTEK